jgi:ring-1,2-phenylacetyl-CoA epoxidase subunit PaaB
MWVVPADSIISKTAQELNELTDQPVRQPARSDLQSGYDNPTTEVCIYAVFCKVKEAGTQTFVGEVQGSSPEQAMQRAIEKYSQGRKPLVWWVLPANQVNQSKPDEVESLYAPAGDKTFRMSTDFHTVSVMRQIRDQAPITKDDR